MADAGSDERFETETLTENIVSSNISKVISHYLQSAERQGSYVTGYVDGKAQLDAFLEDFDRAGCTGFPLRSSTSRAKYDSRPKPVLSSGGRLPRYAGEERIVWSSNSGKVPIPDTHTPFIMAGTRHHHCMFISAKKNHSVMEQGPSPTSSQKASLRKRCVNRLTDDLTSGKASPPVIRYHIRVPLPEAHSDHPLGEAAGCVQKVHPALISKIGQLVQAGISDVRDVQQYLTACTEELLENAVVRPFPTDRRYYPLIKDIQNHVWRFKFKLKEDQARIIDLEEHDYLGSMEDFPITDPRDTMTTQAMVGGGLNSISLGYDNELDDVSDEETCSRPNVASSFLQQHTIQTGNPVAIDCVLGDGSTIPYMLTPVEMVSVGSETEISTAGVQRHLGNTPMLNNSFLDDDVEYWQKAAMTEIERLQALTSLCTNAAKLKEISERVNHMWLSLKKEVLPND
ncbi:hypothetical protein Bbelb_014310 [Branchiostoma belcheri]|nr:hypothetical protein Bbelb_014310 [Branchiostoma belcheri]